MNIDPCDSRFARKESDPGLKQADSDTTYTIEASFIACLPVVVCDTQLRILRPVSPCVYAHAWPGSAAVDQTVSIT